MSDFPKRLKLLREQAGLTQAELAKSMGLSHSVISKYEAGVICPGLKSIIDLAQALRVSTDQLLGLDGVPEYEDLEIKTENGWGGVFRNGLIRRPGKQWALNCGALYGEAIGAFLLRAIAGTLDEMNAEDEEDRDGE